MPRPPLRACCLSALHLMLPSPLDIRTNVLYNYPIPYFPIFARPSADLARRLIIFSSLITHSNRQNAISKEPDPMSLASNATLYAGRSNAICYLQMVLLAPCCQTCRSMGLRDTLKTFDPGGSERNTFFLINSVGLRLTFSV
jgi:hypothetical protein